MFQLAWAQGLSSLVVKSSALQLLGLCWKSPPFCFWWLGKEAALSGTFKHEGVQRCSLNTEISDAKLRMKLQVLWIAALKRWFKRPSMTWEGVPHSTMLHATGRERHANAKKDAFVWKASCFCRSSNLGSMTIVTIAHRLSTEAGLQSFNKPPLLQHPRFFRILLWLLALLDVSSKWLKFAWLGHCSQLVARFVYPLFLAFAKIRIRVKVYRFPQIMAWCFHGGLFSFTKIVTVSDSCEICTWFPILHFSSRFMSIWDMFQLHHICTAVQGGEFGCHLRPPKWRGHQESTTNWRVGKHMLCHLAVKQYIKLFEIFVTKSVELRWEFFESHPTLCKVIEQGSHKELTAKEAWFERRSFQALTYQELPEQLARAVCTKHWQQRKEQWWLDRSPNELQSSHGAQIALWNRYLGLPGFRQRRERAEGQSCCHCSLVRKRKKRMDFGVAPAPQRSGCLIECAARLHCRVLMASLASFSVDYLWIWHKHSFLSWRQEVVFLLNLSKAHLGFEVFLLAQRSQFQRQFCPFSLEALSLISPHDSAFAPGSVFWRFHKNHLSQ